MIDVFLTAMDADSSRTRDISAAFCAFVVACGNIMWLRKNVNPPILSKEVAAEASSFNRVFHFYPLIIINGRQVANHDSHFHPHFRVTRSDRKIGSPPVVLEPNSPIPCHKSGNFAVYGYSTA